MSDDVYGIGPRSKDTEIWPPALDYKPRRNLDYQPEIALIGCGGIAATHLKAYREAGFKVTALCDINLENARKLQQAYYPEARIYTDYQAMLKDDAIAVVDMATYPEIRARMYHDVIAAGKHILSQKPFVTSIPFGREIIDLAARQGVTIAVNQNGRWAPHFRYITRVIEAGLIGEVIAAHFSVTWNHNWIAGTPFEDVQYVLLYDFGIHWFDLVNVFLQGRSPIRVYASAGHAKGQTVKPPFLSQAVIEFEDAQASISFDADSKIGQEDRTIVVGTHGLVKSVGPDLLHQNVELFREEGIARPQLEGNWFLEGFQGTMAELLAAIQEKREPANSARNNLKSLELCFAAVASADSQRAVVPGKEGFSLIK